MAHKNSSNDSPYKRRRPASATPNSEQSLLGKHKKPNIIYELEEANDRLFDIFKNHHFPVNHTERKQLAQLYRLLMQEQEHNNFTRLLSLKDIAIKHFMDCMIIPKIAPQIFPLSFPLMDMGTGPGFPGIPLKILYPDKKIILSEGVQKRVLFLKKIRQELDLKNLDIFGRNIAEDFMYPVNAVITRAVEDIDNTLRNVQGCLQKDGFVFFMKGPQVDPEIESAEKKWQEHYKLVINQAYELPHTPLQRRLVVYKKRTPPLYWVDEDSEFRILKDELSEKELARWKKYHL